MLTKCLWLTILWVIVAAIAPLSSPNLSDPILVCRVSLTFKMTIDEQVFAMLTGSYVLDNGNNSIFHVNGLFGEIGGPKMFSLIDAMIYCVLGECQMISGQIAHLDRDSTDCITTEGKDNNFGRLPTIVVIIIVAMIVLFTTVASLIKWAV